MLKTAQGDIIGTTPLRRILRIRQVREATGLSTSAIYAKMARDEFPKPVKISGNRVGWWADDIAAWQDSLTEAAAQ